MKYKFLILITVFLNLRTNAVFFQNENCSNPKSYFCISENNTILNNYVKNVKQPINIHYNIPVKFWIIRNDEGKGKITISYLKELIQYLNYYYSINNTGIRFSLRPDFEYIDKSKLLNLHYYMQAPFQAFKRKSKVCINVIITDNLIKNKFLNSRKKKFAGTYNFLFHSVIISQNTSTSTLSHEIGHFLGLKHPHRGWKHKWFQEPVSRTKKIPLSNKLMCEHRGDKLCDTPAEPNLTKYTDKNCNYTGWNVKDKYGKVYKPDTHNIMSYTNNRECRNKFTKQQKALMLYTLKKNKYSKYWRTDLPENKKYLPDAFEPDNYKETASEIFFNTPQTHSFHFINTGKKNNFIHDNIDRLYFNLKTKKPQTVNLKISGIKNTSSEIKIQIYNNNSLISEKILPLKTPQQISILNAFPGKYTIKIEQIVENKQETFYKIMINK